MMSKLNLKNRRLLGEELPCVFITGSHYVMGDFKEIDNDDDVAFLKMSC
jgi:hypothetical protein